MPSSVSGSMIKIYGNPNNGGGGLVPKSSPALVTQRAVVHQAPLSTGFPRQEYWSGLPFPAPGDLPNPGIEPGCPTSQADSLPTEPPGKSYPNYGYSLKQDGKAKTNQQICLQRKALDYSLKPLLLQSSYQPLKGKHGTLPAHWESELQGRSWKRLFLHSEGNCLASSLLLWDVEWCS